MIVHATVTDLAAEPWSVTADNAVVLLRLASRLVDQATMTAIYAVDGTGRATDADVLAVLRDATCAQAAAWATLGIDPIKGRADDSGTAAVASKTIGSGSIAYDRSGAVLTAQARQEAATTLAPEAWQILAAAGLLSPARVWLHG
jgi:hypothetical protein